ncbi:unnamed protein product, partial [Mesorhabditis belari]|uniref:Uncharacterized protein n=1 Tax=Mesorhabditis belari TaxID=2138241 RepID=A0AAF3EM68_9BILA
MYSILQSIKRNRFLERYHDLLFVALLTALLLGLYALLTNIYLFFWTLLTVQPDISDELRGQIVNITSAVSSGVLLASLPVTPIAVFYAVTNNRLSLPIRLLAAGENANKFVYALSYGSIYFCDLSIPNLECSDELTTTFNDLFLIVTNYGVVDMAQYCQVLISLRTEALLMMQMLASTLFTLTNTIFAYFIGIFINFFFGVNILELFNEALYFNQFFLFHFVASAISVLCFRKPRERSKTPTQITVISMTPIPRIH